LLGFLAGLVGVTPAAGFVTPSGAFVIGIITGALCFLGVKIKNIFDFDDSLDAFGVHCVAGIAGGLLTGLLANSAINEEDVDGAFHGSGHQLGIQIYGMVVSLGWSVFGTALVMLFVDKLIGLRVSAQSELVGLDRAEHGSTMTSQASHAPQRRKDENISFWTKLQICIGWSSV
jgi:ammonium transporter, Amt family